MQLPVFVGLRRSHLLDVSVLILVFLAIASIFYFAGERSIQSALVFITWAFAVSAWLNLKPYFQKIRLERSGYILAARADELEFEKVALQPYSLVHSWLTVIRLKTEAGSIHTLVVARDSLTDTDFRHLRMFLRWQAQFIAPGGDI